FSIDNSLKAYIGEEAALKDPAAMASKKKAEDALRKAIAANAKTQQDFGDAWDAIAKERKDLPTYERERRFLESQWGFNSGYFDTARDLVRMAEESTKPNAQRLPEYTDANRESLEQELYSPAPIYDDFEILKLADALTMMRDEMGANNEIVKRVLAGQTPQARAEELVKGTTLKDVEARKKIATGGVQAIESSTDPMIQIARSIDKEARAARKRYETEV